jgi:sugar phosphate isomerase/epimerase
MKFTLCNEVIRELPFDRQCALAAGLGYQGLELAPFTLGKDAWRMPLAERAALRRTAADHGLAISGLHWLLVDPAGLSITSADADVRRVTIDVMRGLIGLCRDLGGTYLVHGSPGQRKTGGDPQAHRRGREAFASIASDAAAACVTYCIEPLSPDQTDFVNTVDEAIEIVNAIANPAVATMIDACSTARAGCDSLEALIRLWLPVGSIAHIHFNDRNRRGPGQGSDRFGPALAALRDNRYSRWIGVEPFEYSPDGPTTAARCIGYLKGLMEAGAA